MNNLCFYLSFFDTLDALLLFLEFMILFAPSYCFLRLKTPKFETLIQMHKDKSCDGQFLFFANPIAGAAGSPLKAAKELKRNLD